MALGQDQVLELGLELVCGTTLVGIKGQWAISAAGEPEVSTQSCHRCQRLLTLHLPSSDDLALS